MATHGPHQLAYEAAVHALEDQASVLESLRARAGTIFAATALVTSFLGGQAVDRTRAGDFPFGLGLWSWGGAALLLFVVLAVLTVAILWPYDFRFSVSAGEMLGIVLMRQEQGTPVTAEEAYGELALQYEAMYDHNARWIRRLFSSFRLAILCLVGEVATWIEVVRELP